jgi:hypothetical protein
LLAPLAYPIHHGEKHLIFDFRAWRLRYFVDSNALSTEAVLAIDTSGNGDDADSQDGDVLTRSAHPGRSERRRARRCRPVIRAERVVRQRLPHASGTALRQRIDPAEMDHELRPHRGIDGLGREVIGPRLR